MVHQSGVWHVATGQRDSNSAGRTISAAGRHPTTQYLVFSTGTRWTISGRQLPTSWTSVPDWYSPSRSPPPCASIPPPRRASVPASQPDVLTAVSASCSWPSTIFRLRTIPSRRDRRQRSRPRSQPRKRTAPRRSKAMCAGRRNRIPCWLWKTCLDPERGDLTEWTLYLAAK
jgi:hypothetical protein